MGQLITPSRQLIVGGRGFRKPARAVLDPQASINRGRVACWPLGDVANGKTAEIARGNGATFSAAQAFGSSHHGGQSVTFSSGNLDAPSSAQYDGAFGSWVGWFKTSQSVSGVNPLIMSRVDASGSQSGIDLYLDSATGKLSAQFKSAGGTAATFSVGSGAPNDGKWHMAALTFRQANGSTQSLYLDGVKATTTVAIAWSFNGQHVRWGQALDAFWQQWTGSLDGFSWFNRVLSDSEIALLYAEPYAGIVEQAPRWRVGSAAAPGTFNPGWATGATRVIGVGMY